MSVSSAEREGSKFIGRITGQTSLLLWGKIRNQRKEPHRVCTRERSRERSVRARRRRCTSCKPAGRTRGGTRRTDVTDRPSQTRLLGSSRIYLSRVLLLENRRLLQEESEGVAQLRSRSGPAVPTRVHDLPTVEAATASLRQLSNTPEGTVHVL